LRGTVTSLWLALVFTLAFAFETSHAFGALGHQVVADLAQDMLTPRARAQALALMGPPSGGGKGGPGARLSAISVWADDVKSLRPETRPWHYVTLQLAEPGYHPAKADSPNVVTALNRSLRVLADTAAGRYAREEALKWTVHLVADLHQPLHVGEDRDKGGNLRKVKVGRRTRNLHEVWDYVLLERLKLPLDSLRAMLARSIAADPGFIARNARGTVESWVDETHAKTAAAYRLHGRPMPKDRDKAVQLDRAYLRQNALVVLEQLKIASVRLAMALNAALDPAAPKTPPPPARVPSGWREDTAAWFAAGEDAAGLPRLPRLPQFAWSVNSKVYHFSDCRDVGRIKPENLRRNNAPPPGLALHSGCPRKP
jgi:hypothetical protein